MFPFQRTQSPTPLGINSNFLGSFNPILWVSSWLPMWLDWGFQLLSSVLTWFSEGSLFMEGWPCKFRAGRKRRTALPQGFQWNSATIVLQNWVKSPSLNHSLWPGAWGALQSWAGVIRGGLVSLESQGLRVGVDCVLLQKKIQTKMSIKKAVDAGGKI